MKSEERQCTDCEVDKPYDKEIKAGGILCGGCGRTRPNTKYVLAEPLSDGQDLKAALEEIIEYEENIFKRNKESADWFNNNTPGVGQKVDYMSYSPLPYWVEKLKTLIKK